MSRFAAYSLVYAGLAVVCLAAFVWLAWSEIATDADDDIDRELADLLDREQTT